MRQVFSYFAFMNTVTESNLNPDSLQAPELAKYLDYRKFLSDWYQYKKATSASYSGAKFAKKANIKSHSLLGMVIRGERNLTYKTIQSFIAGLDLKRENAKYFENLVLYNQAETHDEKIKYLSLFKSAQITANPFIREIKDVSLYFSTWYVVAIRELALLPDFKADPEWICRKLKRCITREQAEQSLDLLKRLDLIRVTAGTCTRTEGTLQLQPDKPHLSLREFYKSFFKRMIHAVDHEPMEEREMGSVTLAVSTEEMALIKIKMREAMDAIIQTFGNHSEDKRHVIMVQMQALQLTNQDQ